MNKTQKGFAVLEGLLIFLIVGLIGGTGYYVWHSQNQTDKILAQADKTSQSTIASAKKTTTNQASSQKYLTIKEWGVRFKLPVINSSLYYLIKQGNPNSAYLGFKTYDKVAPFCGADQVSVGVIFRQALEEYQRSLDNPNGANPPATTKLGNYYYGYLHPQAACVDGSTAMESAIAKAEPEQDLYQIFSTIELIQ